MLISTRTPRFTAATALALLALMACETAPRISATSDADCYASLAQVSDDAATSSDSAEYAAAMTSMVGQLALSSISSAFVGGFGSLFDNDAPSVHFPSPDSSVLQGALCEALDGLSAREVVEGAHSLRQDAAQAFERRYAQVKMRILEDAQQRHAAIADSLAGFKVHSARLIQELGWVGLEATIVLAVENSTHHPISKVFFHGVAISEGRSIPWIEESFNYSIPGGLEPRERATWRLSPNMFLGDWTSVTVPADARFDVEVMRLNGPDGEALWGGISFTSGDKHLLDSLVVRFGHNP